MQAQGTDAVIVPDKTSVEAYHDYSEPHKFRGALESLYDDHAGTAIYRIPRVHPGIGRVVDNRAIASAGKMRSGDDWETLAKYVRAVEDPSAPAVSVKWTGFDGMGVQATVSAGQSLLVQESFDPAWRAEENGKAVAIRAEPFMGFMLLDVSPGYHEIHLRFATPLENRIGEVLFGLSCLAILGLLAAGRKPRALQLS